MLRGTIAETALTSLLHVVWMERYVARVVARGVARGVARVVARVVVRGQGVARVVLGPKVLLGSRGLLRCC